MKISRRPARLYRYRGLGTSTFHTLSELGGHIWFGNAKGLNDPFDGLAMFEPETVVSPRSPSSADPTMLRWVYQWCVACFSETWDDPQMWAHYAREHTGICVAYDTDELLQIVDELNGREVRETDGAVRRRIYTKAGYIRKASLGAVRYLPSLSNASTDGEEALFKKVGCLEAREGMASRSQRSFGSSRSRFSNRLSASSSRGSYRSKCQPNCSP